MKVASIQPKQNFFDNDDPTYPVKRFVFNDNSRAEIAFHNDTPENILAIQQHVQSQHNITLETLPLENQLRLRFMRAQPFSNFGKDTNDVVKALGQYMSPKMKEEIQVFQQQKSPQPVSF